MNTGWGALATGDAQPYPWRAWRPQLALLAITLGAFALFTWRLDAKSIWWDESLSLYRAQRSVSYILSNRIDFPGASTVDLHPPLYFLLLRGITQTWGESDWILRFPSALWATLTVPLLYAMGRRLRGPRAGLAAALLGALSPFLLWYAQEARMYTMVTALGLGAAYCLWRAAGERRLRWALGCVAASAAAMSTQYLYALLLGMHALLAATRWPRLNPLRRHANHRRRDAILLAALGAAMIVMVATGRVAVERALGPHAGRNYLPLYLMLRDAVNSFTVGLSMSLRQAWPLDLLAAL
ncbi:MAG: glycosyltransferase family 39 protein, partial [Chloroflexota bacterium]